MSLAERTMASSLCSSCGVRLSHAQLTADEPSATAPERWVKVSGASSEQLTSGRVIIVRDITDRHRYMEAEMRVRSELVAREKDEEANRFGCVSSGRMHKMCSWSASLA